jgi:hypothetical protein
VTLYYNTFVEVGQSQNLNVWAAIMQLVVNSLKVKNLPQTALHASSLTP